MNGRISLSVANQIPPQSETAPPVLLSQTQHSTPRVRPSLPRRRSSEHVAGDRATGGHGHAAGPVPVPGAGEAAPSCPPLLRRLPIAAGGGVLVAAAEEGDQAPHEDAAHEDAAVGHQAPPHAVPAAPAGLDARGIRRHGTRDPRPRSGCGRLRLRQPRHVAKRLKLFP